MHDERHRLARELQAAVAGARALEEQLHATAAEKRQLEQQLLYVHALTRPANAPPTALAPSAALLSPATTPHSQPPLSPRYEQTAAAPASPAPTAPPPPQPQPTPPPGYGGYSYAPAYPAGSPPGSLYPGAPPVHSGGGNGAVERSVALQ